MKKIYTNLLIMTSIVILCSCSTPSGTSSTSSSGPNTSSNLSSSSSEIELKNTNLYLVGDSTVSSFEDTTYYYPRYGYGTQIQNYMNDKVTIINLALSGRSSKSFINETNYQTLKSNIKEGDFLLIGFGHNDQKEDDASRFTNANLPTTDKNSFKYSLYENYIKLAIDAKATPILCTPIVRANKTNDYSGSHGHITSNGNYSKAILDLASEKNIEVVDLTKLTKDLYTEIGYENAIYFHAMTNAKKDGDNIIADTSSVDTTHLNIYGAKYISYLLTKNLYDNNISLGKYVLNNKILTPTKDKDLISNPDFVYKDYTAPDLISYIPKDHFSTLSKGYYGTGFGDTGGDPASTSNGYIAKEVSEGIFHVGQYLEGGSKKGKFASSSEGFAFLFRQLETNKNFKMTVNIKVLTSGDTKQAGFGLMLRDDSYLPNKNASIVSNYVAAGFLCNESDMIANFSRSSNTKITKSEDVISSLYAVNDTAVLEITRVGQKITTKVIYKDKTYTKEYLDFPLNNKDNEYMYIGIFANRGTTIECSNIVFEDLGEASEA